MKKILIATTAGVAASVLALSALASPGEGGPGFDRMDANGDGKLTAEEMNEHTETLIEAADANGDGAVTKEEMQAFHEAKRAEWRENHNPDTNGDGVVDRTEFQQAADKRFDMMDKNGDGVLSEDEQPRHRGHHRRGGRFGGPDGE